MGKITVENIKNYIKQIEYSIELIKKQLVDVNWRLEACNRVLENGSVEVFKIALDEFEKRLDSNITDEEYKYCNENIIELKKYIKLFEEPSRFNSEILELEEKNDVLVRTLESLKLDLNSCTRILHNIAYATVLKDEELVAKIVEDWIIVRQERLGNLQARKNSLENELKLVEEVNNLFKGGIDFHYSNFYSAYKSRLYCRPKETIFYKSYIRDLKKLIVSLKKMKDIKKIEECVSKYGSQSAKKLLEIIKNLDLKAEKMVNDVVLTFIRNFNELAVFINAIERAKCKMSQEVLDECFERKIDSKSTLFIKMWEEKIEIVPMQEIIEFVEQFDKYDEDKDEYLTNNYNFNIKGIKEFLKKFNINTLSIEDAYIIYEYFLSLPIEMFSFGNDKKICFRPKAKILLINKNYSRQSYVSKKLKIKSLKNDIQNLEKQIFLLQTKDYIESFYRLSEYQTVLRDDITLRGWLLAGEVDITMEQVETVDIVLGRSK